VDAYKEVAQLIQDLGHVVAFTGAGISVDAGIPAFRGGQGLWEKYDPIEYAHIHSFLNNPAKVWNMLREMAAVIFAAKPSPAHLALSELERLGALGSVITQNVDGLHQIAGNTDVIEYHGNHRRLICPHCSTKTPFAEDQASIFPYPKCDHCGEALKPDVVFFGEQIPFSEANRASDAARNCRILLIIGTSGVVYPAAELPFTAHSCGAKVVEINVSPTPFTSSICDYFLEGSASDILPKVMECMAG
jgi:NAD-dependent deacetylase